MTTPKTPLALVVQVEENYPGSYRAVARVCLPQPNGELHNVSWSSYSHGADVRRYDGLEVTAYAGTDRPSDADDWSGTLWGYGVHYAPHRVENAAHARAIAGVLARIERGLERAASDDGYIRDGEFARYVMRVARALGIRTVYVRSLPRQFAMTGERYRVVDTPALDYWVQEVTAKIASRELAALVRG